MLDPQPELGPELGLKPGPSGGGGGDGCDDDDDDEMGWCCDIADNVDPLRGLGDPSLKYTRCGYRLKSDCQRKISEDEYFDNFPDPAGGIMIDLNGQLSPSECVPDGTPDGTRKGEE